eukprot:scaffold672_cov126-Cylindrotheca_fusiformis.AAC.31
MGLLPVTVFFLTYSASVVLRARRSTALGTAMSVALDQARALEAPVATSTDGGQTEHLDFWSSHDDLIKQAWKEWNQDTILPELTETSIVDPAISKRVQSLWKSFASLENEKEFQSDFWEEPIPGVHTCNHFLTEDGVRRIRTHLKAASQSGIPTRRPNGMNRFGLVLDEETEGGVSYPEIDRFRRWLVQEYIRPLGRMFFPEYISSQEDDEMSYAFTIHYKQPDGAQKLGNNTVTDVKLKEHSDASVVTMNINLNFPEEQYSGAQLLFLDEPSQKRHPLRMEPGMAVVHRGLHRHQALPIGEGERHQLVVWLMGRGGYVRFVPYEEKDLMSVQERWSTPSDARKESHVEW